MKDGNTHRPTRSTFIHMFDIPALLLSVLLNVVFATAAATSVQGQVLRILYTKLTGDVFYMTPDTPPLSPRPKFLLFMNWGKKIKMEKRKETVFNWVGKYAPLHFSLFQKYLSLFELVIQTLMTKYWCLQYHFHYFQFLLS